MWSDAGQIIIRQLPHPTAKSGELRKGSEHFLKKKPTGTTSGVERRFASFPRWRTELRPTTASYDAVHQRRRV